MHWNKRSVALPRFRGHLQRKNRGECVFNVSVFGIRLPRMAVLFAGLSFVFFLGLDLCLAISRIRRVMGELLLARLLCASSRMRWTALTMMKMRRLMIEILLVPNGLISMTSISGVQLNYPFVFFHTMPIFDCFASLLRT